MTFKIDPRTEESIHAVMEIEEELDLFEKKINGIYFWERIRKYIRHELADIYKAEELNDSPQHLEPHSRYKGYLKRFYLMIRNLFIKNPFLVSEKEVLMWGWRREKTGNGKAIGAYCDPIAEELERSYVLYETHHRNEHYKPESPKLKPKYLDLIVLGAAFLDKIGLVESSLDDEDKKLIEDIEKRVEEKFGHALNVESIVRKVLARRKVKNPLYDFLLSRVDPEIAVLGRSSGGMEDFVEVCKKKGIPTVELQHGNMHPLSPTWSYPGDKRKKRNFPDYFFSFGEYWNEAISFPVEDDNLIAVGFPYVEKKYEEFKGLPKKKQILFISQHPIGGEFSKIAVDLEKMIEDYEIIYRLHPGEFDTWKEDYPWLEESDVKVDAGQDLLHKLLSESVIQVGVSSTAIYEGFMHGLSTYLVDLASSNHMRNLVEEENIPIASNVEELEKLIVNEEGGCPEDPERYFRKNSIDNILNTFDEIIEN